MIVLGFDTATTATAVGLMLDDGGVIEARDDPPAGARPGHSTRLLSLARELLEQAHIGWDDVRLIGVGTGPGTFTGLRVGVSTARGLAQSLGVDLTGVSSTRALAHAVAEPADVRIRGGEGVPGEPSGGVLAVIDARRGEAFAGAYRAGEELVPPRPLPPQRLAEVLELAGAAEEPESWIAVGDGALRFVETLQALGVSTPEADSPLHRISGRAICQLAMRTRTTSGGEVTPAYGRAPDAKPGLQGVLR